MQIQISTNQPNKLLGLLMAMSKVFPEHTNDLLQLSRSGSLGITVEILPIKPAQTDEQRGYYHQAKNDFAKWAGNTPDEMHEHILAECFGSDTVQTAIGWRRRPHKRSSDADRTDYSQLIETLIRVAAEFGYVIPPPTRRLRDG